MSKKLRTIGQVSKQAGITVETIRYYEKVGLVSAPMRTEGGNRLFDDEAVQKLFFIRRARELGFSLDEVNALLQLTADSKVDCVSAQSIADKHLKDIKAKISDLKRLARVLSELSEKCDSHESTYCPILESLNQTNYRRSCESGGR